MSKQDELHNNKTLARERAKRHRKGLSKSDIARLSSEVTDRAIDYIGWSEVNSVHIYQPLTNHAEVDTSKLIQYLWNNHSRIKTASWYKSGGKYLARWINLKGWGNFIDTSFQYDLIIVPLLAFNEKLHRIGYGGGFYDKLLASQKRAKLIGLSYDKGYIPGWAEEPHDMPMHTVITEKQNYSS